MAERRVNMEQARSKTADVEIWTERYRILGTVHIPLTGAYKGRLSDFLNKPDTSFLALTDVTISSLVADDTLWQGNFLALNKAEIVLVKALRE